MSAPFMRPLAEADQDAASRLIEMLTGHPLDAEGVRDRLRMVAQSSIDRWFACEVDGEVLGLLGFRLRENLEEVSRFGEVSLLVSDTDSRRQGLGRAMMEFAENLARQEGCIGAWLVSGFGREEQAHRFYQHLGYQINGYRFVKRFE